MRSQRFERRPLTLSERNTLREKHFPRETLSERNTLRKKLSLRETLQEKQSLRETVSERNSLRSKRQTLLSTPTVYIPTN